MGAALAAFVSGALGALASDAVKNAFKKAISIAAILGILIYMVTMWMLPKIFLPDALMSVLLGEELTNVFKAINFFIPLNFILGCFTTILTLRLFSFVWSVILWCYSNVATHLFQ